nr:hypothetical protein [Tanacetum cinerariifolium]
MENVNAQTKTNSLAFRSMLEKRTLTGPKFNEWFRALKLVVRTEKIQDVFETALPPRPVGVGDAPVDPQALAEWTAKYDRHNEVACLMLRSMTPRLYQQFEHKTPLEMYNELYQMYGKPPGVELQELIHLFHTCKQGDGTSVKEILKKGQNQIKTGQKQEAAWRSQEKFEAVTVDRARKTEQNAKRRAENANTVKSLLKLKRKKERKGAKGKGKAKGGQYSYPSKTKKPQLQMKERPAKEGQCYHCKEVGHWKRKCPIYLAELKKKKSGHMVASTSSGI